MHGLDVGSGVWVRLRMGLDDSRRVRVGEGGRSVDGTFVVGAGTFVVGTDRPVHLLRL